MSTKYYAVKNGPTLDAPILIGQSSFGWLFLFIEQNEPFADNPVVWHEYAEVIDWLDQNTVKTNEYVIMNEYGNIITLDEFVAIVDKKQNDPNCQGARNFEYAENRDGYRFCTDD